jgi:hypothetical protein
MTHSQISGQLDEALNRVFQSSFLATDNTQSTFLLPLHKKSPSLL